MSQELCRLTHLGHIECGLLVFSPWSNDSAVAAAWRRRRRRSRATRFFDRDFRQKGIQRSPGIAIVARSEEDRCLECYAPVRELDHQTSTPLGGKDIDEHAPTLLCNETIKDRVSGERPQRYSFARAVVIDVFRAKSNVWVADPFLSQFSALRSGSRSQLGLITEMVEAVPSFYG